MLRSLLLFAFFFESWAVDVSTQYGTVRGHKVNVDNTRINTTVDVFYGIRFANDTSGSLRFKAPVPPEPWGDDVFVADSFGPPCPQVGSLPRNDEDCLHVNIYSPDVSGGPYPVMVWIHGGAYVLGANRQYPGHFLASHGIVVVTVNYRLGTFGFAFTGNDACPGNAGLWDQRMGIQFVKDNIANFGGDPDKLTLMGESAGAGSTSLHIVSPQSKGLFQQAIMESGAETGLWNVNPPDSHPEDQIRGVAEQLNCVRPDDYQMMDCLRELSWTEIQGADVSCGPGYICTGMVPVVDGVFLTKMPGDLREDGDIMTGPILAGFNHDDGALFLGILFGESPENCCTRSQFEYMLLDRIGAYLSPRLTNTTAEDGYHALDYQYSPWPYLHDSWQNRNALVKMVTDTLFGVPWDIQVKHHSNINSVYTYLFNYRSVNETLPDWMGVTHSMELGYVFGAPLLSFNPDVRNDSHFYFGGSFNNLDVTYSLFVQDMFVNFIKNGDPTPQAVPNPLGEDTAWLPYEVEQMNMLYISNVSIHLEPTWEQKAYAFYKDYVMPDVLKLWSTEESVYDKSARQPRVDPEQLTRLLQHKWPTNVDV